MPDEQVRIDVPSEQLTRFKLTQQATSRLCTTLNDYVNELLKRATKLAEAVRSEEDPVEVTQEHIQTAVRSLSGPLTATRRPSWYVPAQVGEYVVAIAIGAAGGHLTDPVGFIVFGGGLFVGLLLVVVRLTRGEVR